MWKLWQRYKAFNASVLRNMPNGMLGLGVIFFVVGIGLQISNLLTLQGSIPAKLTVVRVEQKIEGTSQLFRPTFSTTNAAGRQVEYTGNTWSSPQLHSVGDTVEGWYNETNGKLISASIIDVLSHIGRVFVMVGGALGAIGGVLVWRRRLNSN